MTVNLQIGHLTIDAPDGRRLDPAALKRAIERELAALIEAGGLRGIAGGEAKSVTSGRTARTPGRSTETRVARAAAARIYEATRR